MGFEFEDLFDVRQSVLTLMDEQYWRTEPTGIRAGVMGYRTETLKAGPRLEATVYPRFGRIEERRLRRIRQNETPAQVQRNNRERSVRHLIQLMDANFGAADLSVTLTYGGEAPTFDQCRRDVKKFIGKLRRLRKRMGLEELRYIYVVEDADEDGTKVRPHAHLIINGGIDRDKITALWEKGRTKTDRLQPDMEGLEGIARYMVKSQRRKGKRKWSASRNLKQPQVRVSDTKVSNAKVRKLATGFEGQAKEIAERLYPGYQFVRSVVRYSDYTDGVMLRILMRRKGAEP